MASPANDAAASRASTRSRPWLFGPWAVDLSDSLALADVRARYAVALSGIMIVLTVVVASLSPPEWWHDNGWSLIFLAPVAVIVAWAARRRERLGDGEYVILQLLGDVSAIGFTALAQPRGSVTSMELSLLFPVIFAGIFCGRRREVAVGTVLALLALAFLVWLRREHSSGSAGHRRRVHGHGGHRRAAALAA